MSDPRDTRCWRQAALAHDEEDDIPAGDGGEPDLGVELVSEELGLLDGRLDRRVLIEGGESGGGERGPEDVGAVHGIAQDETGVAQHRQRRMRRRDVDAEVLDELTDREPARGVRREERQDARRAGRGGGGSCHMRGAYRLAHLQ